MEWLLEISGANNTTEAVYWLIAVISTSYLVLKTILNFWGLDLDYDFDLDTDIDHDFGFGHYEVSLSSILAFFAAAGWTGYILLKELENEIIAHISALAIGIITMIIAVILYSKIKHLESSGNIDIKNAIGKIGKVYLSILPEKGGQVSITIQGRRYIFDAITEDNITIKTGQKVLVYNVIENKLVVEPFNEETFINELREEIPLSNKN